METGAKHFVETDDKQNILRKTEQKTNAVRKGTGLNSISVGIPTVSSSSAVVRADPVRITFSGSASTAR